jgi:NAD(P)-dependent dehydrogenase (short-subunit alcohol dehydrogenase family)
VKYAVGRVVTEAIADVNLPLAGQHAVVTGAGTGIGAAVCDELARLGASLTLVGRRQAPLGETRTRLARHAVEVVEAPADVTDAAAVAAAIGTATSRLGRATILVNNAGAAETAPFLEIDAALLERMMAVNFGGTVNCTQAVLPGMLLRRQGRIVNIASTAGVTGYPYVAAYCAAKHAVVGLTRALAREYAQSGVTVNAVCPGFTDTDLVARSVATIAAKTGRDAESVGQALTRTNPTGRLVTPREVAAAVGFLCLPSAAQVTGQAIVVAGGEVMP